MNFYRKTLNAGQTVFLQRGGINYSFGDKVMQIKNNYDKGVFNADIGFISKVDTEERELTVTFDGNKVLYDITELDELVLAYACTIHKSQGSEYPVVIIPLHTSHYNRTIFTSFSTILGILSSRSRGTAYTAYWPYHRQNVSVAKKIDGTTPLQPIIIVGQLRSCCIDNLAVSCYYYIQDRLSGEKYGYEQENG